MDNSSAGKFSRKREVATRYSITTRSVDRKARQGLLPAPEYPLGPHLPLWRNSKLDEHDAANEHDAAVGSHSVLT